MASASFLGFGILAPLRRDQKQDFANGGGLDNLRSCVAQILGTRCAGNVAGDEEQGEIEWRPEFGTLLYRLAHRKGIVLQELGSQYVVDALARWEPRVTNVTSQISFDGGTRTLTIRLVYDVIDRNVPGNAVVVKGVEQTVDLPLAA